jgi:glycerate 2-kinase
MQLPASPVRRLLHKMLRKALATVHAGQALRRVVRRNGHVLMIGRGRYDLRNYERVVVVGAGKAAATMARAIEPLLGRRLNGGLVIVKHGHRTATTRIAVAEAGHPIPDRAGVTAARRLAAIVAELTGRDLLFVLLSGGASSLMVAPVRGVTLRDKQLVTNLLLRCGAGIVEINTVRKHLSTVKGGRLAALSEATVVSLILSDVIGDDVSAIGSGPTAPDPTTYDDAIACLCRYRLWSSVPRSVRTHLKAGAAGRLTETPKPGDRLFRRVHHHIIGNNAAAVETVVSTARSAGWRTVVLPPFMGEARQAGTDLAAMAKRLLMRQRSRQPCCITAGGETIVTVRGSGKGGRAQEFAVAAAKEAAGLAGVYVAAVATDGSDGPTDAAGALVGGETWNRAGRMNVDLDAALTHNDTYRALRRLDCHIMTGPTGTNVNDLYLLFVF